MSSQENKQDIDISFTQAKMYMYLSLSSLQLSAIFPHNILVLSFTEACHSLLSNTRIWEHVFCSLLRSMNYCFCCVRVCRNITDKYDVYRFYSLRMKFNVVAISHVAITRHCCGEMWKNTLSCSLFVLFGKVETKSR